MCFDFPISDNLSERALRRVRTKLKVAGQFQNLDSCMDYTTIISYVETCRRCGKDEFEALKRLEEGNPYTLEEILPEEELKRMEQFKRKTSEKAIQITNQETDNTPVDTETVANEAQSAEAFGMDAATEATEAQTEESVENSTPEEQYKAILEFMSISHPVEEMIPILSARGDAKHLFKKPGKTNAEEDREDVISGEDCGSVQDPSEPENEDTTADSTQADTQASNGRKAKKRKKKSASRSAQKKARKKAPEPQMPDWARRKPKKPVGRPRKEKDKHACA